MSKEKEIIFGKFSGVRALREIGMLGYEWFARYALLYDARLRAKMGFPFRLNMRRIEIETTTSCNLKCFNCDRSCRQAPSSERMSLRQIKKFVDESISLKKKWAVISILGGEPTLHPEIVEICNQLLQYKEYCFSTRIIIVTNGYGHRVNNILKTLPSEIKIANTAKQTPSQDFTTYNVAPIDMDYPDASRIDFKSGCGILSNCGLGLTRYGFYACGAGASADRVFGWDLGIKSLTEVTREKLLGQLDALCSHCGRFKDMSRYKSLYASTTTNQEMMSGVWKAAYEAYSKKPPDLSLY
ncbi:radical SAM protein [Verrucomicrobiota bacterium]